MHVVTKAIESQLADTAAGLPKMVKSNAYGQAVCTIRKGQVVPTPVNHKKELIFHYQTRGWAGVDAYLDTVKSIQKRAEALKLASMPFYRRWWVKLCRAVRERFQELRETTATVQIQEDKV